MKTKLHVGRNTVVLILLSLLALCELTFVVWPRVFVSKKQRIEQYARNVYEKCKSVGYAPSCYDREIPKLMDSVSMEDAFEVTRAVQQLDSRYLYCHVLAHNLSYRETSKDLNKWMDVVSRCPTTFCNNGCQHGAIMRRFNAESLNDTQIQSIIPDLQKVCEPRGKWMPREIERSMCYHALGHLHMFITKADIPKSADLCRTVGTKSDGRNYVQTCIQGVLMSVYQPLEPEDFALVKDITPAKAGVDAFCNKFTGEAWFACHSESWPLFFDDIQKPGGLTKFCSYSEDPSKKTNCIATIMSILTVTLVVNNNSDLSALQSYCESLPDAVKPECYGEAAFRLMQIDPRYKDLAFAVCRVPSDSAVQTVCYRKLMQQGHETYVKGSAESLRFCSQFPESLREECSREGK
jgi:hypothetical protein